jgi:hypothetical protein
MTFECLTGQRPFRGKGLGPLVANILAAEVPAPSSAAPDAGIPLAVDQWMAKALCRDPAGRFESARALADSFRDASAIDDSPSLDASWSRPKPTPAATPGAEPPSPSGTWVNAASFHDPGQPAGGPAGTHAVLPDDTGSVDDGAATLMLPSAADATAAAQPAPPPPAPSGSDLQKTVAFTGGGTLYLEDEAPPLPEPAALKREGPPPVTPAAQSPLTSAPDAMRASPRSAPPTASAAPVVAMAMAHAARPADDWRLPVVVAKQRPPWIPVLAGISLAVLIAAGAWLGLRPRGGAEPGHATPTVSTSIGTESIVATEAPVTTGGVEATVASTHEASPSAPTEPSAPATTGTTGPSATTNDSARGCGRDVDCPGTDVCVKGRCTAPTAAPTASACGKDTDCPGETVCVKGKCAAPTRPIAAKSCGKDSECPGAEVCVKGRCAPPANSKKPR